MSVVLNTNAQNDSVKQHTQKAHSPRTASLLAIVPGAGQAYNHKYWKMPIVYATMGACIYVVVSNQKQFSRYKKAYMLRDAGEVDEFNGILSSQAILNNMDSKRTIRDYALAGTILLYALQIVDANVDAHLFYFDVGDNLSARFYPQSFSLDYARSQKPALGLGCTITF
ncbi:MAG: hypothetical protein HUK15_09635 [Bacteroidales bacterium]|nr:hypothetical protein [Bacteroidales bacterium]